jgi:peptidoglycan/xylan/chitin deacetylase (PgdA/CDA1 family)
MGKYSTWIACGAVAVSLVAAGVVADLMLGGTPVLTIAGLLAAGVYMLGTFHQNVPIFGRVARPREADGRFALTFDDGPDPRHTPQISSYLASRGHRATFFVLGRAATNHPDVVAQLVADGHEVANHGDDHRLLAFTSPTGVRAQLDAAEEAVLRATRQPPAPLFRAPHGVRSPWLATTLRRRGYRLCGWHGRILDTSLPGPETIVGRVAATLEPGAVILLHDGDGSSRGETRAQTVEALPGILDAAEARGLTSVPLGSLVR